MNNLNYKIKIVDDFLSNSDFEELCNLNIDKEIENGFKVYHNEIDVNGIRTSSIDESLLTRVHPKIVMRRQ